MKTRIYYVALLILLLPLCGLMGQCTNITGMDVDTNDDDYPNPGTDTLVCSGAPFVIDMDLSGCSSSLNLDYIWEPSGGIASDGGSGTDHDYLMPDGITTTTTFTFTIMDADEDTIVATESIDVDVTSFSVTLDVTTMPPYCVGDDINLLVLNNPGGDPMGNPSYDWTNATEGFPGNATDFGINEGPQGYSVTVTDEEGCSAEGVASVEVNDYPSIMLDNNASYCLGTDIVITASGGSDCVWTFPNNATLNNCVLTINNAALNDSGEYSIEIENNGCSSSQNIDIEIDDEPVSLNPSPDPANNNPFCVSDGSIDLDPSPGGGSYEITGDTPDSDPISNDFFDPGDAGAGTYTVTYTSPGCGGTASTVIEVLDFTPVSIAVSPSMPLPVQVCEDSPCFTLIGSPSGGSFNPPLVNDVFCPNVFGVDDHTISYEFINAAGCESSTTIIINVNSSIVVTTGDDINICEGTTAQLGGSADGGGNGNYIFSWTPEATLNDPSSNMPQASGLVDDTDFTCMVTNDYGCSDVAVQSVFVHPQPTVFITMDPESICEEDTPILTANVAGGFGNQDYLWSPSGASETDNTITTVPINSDASYSVQVFFDPGSAGCGPVTSPAFNIAPEEKPDPMIESESNTVCSNEQVIFVSLDPRPGSNFDWEFIGTEPPLISSEQIGPLFIVHFGDVSAWTTARVHVDERLGENCEDDDFYDLSFSTGTAPDPAEIFLSTINNTLVYNDADVDCYQWGYYEEGTGNEEVPNEVYQSYVAGDLYDPNRIYWCRAWLGDCSSCSTIAIYREGEGNVVTEEEPKFLLYPNPNNGNFKLEINQLFPDTEYDIQIINMLGQLVNETTVMTNSDDDLNTTLQLNNAAAGVYYMALYLRGDLQKIQSFIVQP